MPPKRKSGGTTSRNSSQAAQSTLSFNSKSARVTKPSATSPSASKASTRKVSTLEQELELDRNDVQTTSLTPDPEPEPEPTSPSIPTRSKPQPTGDEAQQKADKVTDLQIKRYWQAEEATRLAPRVHQQHLSTHEKILRHFDLSSQYGPCIGTPRLKRWQRAEGLGLKPPIEVLAVLLREEKAGHGKGKMAYVDELAGGRVGVVE